MKRTSRLYSLIESRWFLPSIAFFALLLRLSLVFITYKFKTTVFADEIDYMNIGISLAHGHGFIKDGIHYTAYRPPAQPLMIALLFNTMGQSIVLVKVVEALLLTAIPFICFRIGRLLGLSIVAANVGAALATLHPALAYASSTLYPTVLTTVALTLGVWLCSLAAKNERMMAAAGAGLAFGVAGSATTTFAPLAAIAGALLLFRRSYRSALIVAILGTMPVVLWMARNDRVMGRFTVATNGGYNLYLGANDLATPMSGNWVDPHLYSENALGEIAVDDDYKAAATQWIRNHPTHWGELAAARSVVVFDSVGNPRTQGLHSGLVGHLMGWIMLPVVLFGLLGLAVCYKQPLSWFTLAALLLVVASSAATIAKPRFRFPCDPLLAEFSVAGFLYAKKKLSTNEPQASSEALTAGQ